MSTSFRDSIDRDRPFLSVTNDKEASAEASKEDENGEEYYSVQDAIDSESVLDEQESESECMSVFSMSDSITISPLTTLIYTVVSFGQHLLRIIISIATIIFLRI